MSARGAQIGAGLSCAPGTGSIDHLATHSVGSKTPRWIGWHDFWMSPKEVMTRPASAVSGVNEKVSRDKMVIR